MIDIMYFLASFLVGLIVIYGVRFLSIKYNIVDIPNGRKIHDKPVALMGGVAILISIFIMLIFHTNGVNKLSTFEFLIPAFLIVILGIIDDLYDLKATHKLFFQILISIYASVLSGGVDVIEIYSFSFEFPYIVGILIQSVWLIVLINAFNLIDGLDGLATGTGIISFGTILFTSFLLGDSTLVVVLYIVIGVLFAFLFYNFNPATIYLGDSGSMLIGLLVGLLSIGSYKSVTLSSAMLIILITFLPILDVILSIIRRKKNNLGAFKADSLHMHHRLLKIGYSHVKSVLIMYLFMIIYSISAIIITVGNYNVKIIFIIFLLLFTIYIFERFYLLSNKYTFVSNIFKINRKNID